MEVLVHLAREPSAVVSIVELVERLWPRLESGRDAVHRSITELRRALGDDAKHPTYIETIPKRGYRLMRPVGG
jgi:DNA-binding winged helix-turn-helix (wHTH) protein